MPLGVMYQLTNLTVKESGAINCCLEKWEP
jgi:hypothetical protein